MTSPVTIVTRFDVRLSGARVLAARNASPTPAVGPTAGNGTASPPPPNTRPVEGVAGRARRTPGAQAGRGLQRGLPCLCPFLRRDEKGAAAPSQRTSHSGPQSAPHSHPEGKRSVPSSHTVSVGQPNPNVFLHWYRPCTGILSRPLQHRALCQPVSAPPPMPLLSSSDSLVLLMDCIFLQHHLCVLQAWNFFLCQQRLNPSLFPTHENGCYFALI